MSSLEVETCGMRVWCYKYFKTPFVTCVTCLNIPPWDLVLEPCTANALGYDKYRFIVIHNTYNNKKIV